MEEVSTDLVATCARRWASVKGPETNAPDPGAPVGHFVQRGPRAWQYADTARSIYASCEVFIVPILR